MTEPMLGDSLRARTWCEFVGQLALKERLSVHIEAATAQDRMLDHVLLAGPPGFGKGHPLDTPILTPTGWNEIGNLAIGDEVIGADGATTTVTGVFDRGELDTFEVTFNDGATTICDGDHLWRVSDSHRRSSIRSTSDLMAAGVKDASGRAKWRVPTVGPVAHPPVPLPIEPYLLGVLLANGHLEGTPAITTDDTWIVAEIRDLNPGLELTLSVSPSSTAGRWHIQDFRDTLRGVGLYGLRSAEKFIPAEYLVADEATRRALLAGLMDCDGSVRTGKGGAAFYTSSPALADGVRSLAESLGGIVYIRRYDYPNSAGEEFNVGVVVPDNPFRLDRKRSAWTPTMFSRRIEKIAPHGRAAIRCIQVAAADCLYVTDRYVVTHNTTVAQIIADELGDPFAAITMPVKPAVLAALLRQFEGGILLLDEIHRAPQSQQEDLLGLLDAGVLRLPTGRSIVVEHLTIIGATTEPEKLVAPLYDRFPVKPMFQAYSDDEMGLIVQLMAKKVGLEFEPEFAVALGRAAGGTPRNARQLVLGARDISCSERDLSVEAVLRLCAVEADGLTAQHLQYLRILAGLQGQAGLSVLASMLRMHPASIQQLERFLLERSYIVFGAGGRELTSEGYARIKTTTPNPRLRRIS